MQVLKLKATLRDTDPLVWRTLCFHPETGLEQVSDMLLIAMGWDEENTPLFISNDGPITPDDDAWYDANLNDYLVKHGDLLSYSKESDDEFHVELELIAVAEESVGGQLPRIDDGAHQAPPENIGGLEAYARYLVALNDANHPDHKAAREVLGDDYDPASFNIKDRNEEASDLFDDDEQDFDLAIVPENTLDHEFDPTDIDAHSDIFFRFDWLETIYGLKVSDGNVRNTPQELIDFRTALTEDDLESPRQYRKLVEPLYKKFPNEPSLMLEMAGLYGLTGENSKSRRLFRELSEQHPGNLEILTGNLLALETGDEFIAEAKNLPHPLDIRNHPAGKDGYYHTTEFLSFEEVAIRYAVHHEDIYEALRRLDRLVNFGFLHGDVEQAAFAVAGLMLILIEDAVEAGKLDPEAEDIPESFFAPVSDRTKAILDAATADVLSALEGIEEAATPVQRTGPKVGRNDPCPCGSGKKHKKCCL
ncbi:hypothetical protein FUA23_21015 [Neolewinella aurantiaca]|uniref:Plasmid pRiA4b Orf3-like domain-containing protein n=1 Tax=Neolewinella aurantiaca TaxID=2602767 RepID=A0A5C7FJP1_9BACT|nr:SEC-C metal-binding domain-containing protein [Neolewinella aurantiaca]TXF84726.1 hypothetical protein FUA23_21015 [Neolewinella aurantiaca]